MTPSHMTHQRQKWLLAAAVAVALALAGSYQLWVGVIQDRTETKIVRTTSTCQQVDRLYSAVVRLMQDDAAFTAASVQAMQRQRRDRLGVQGCPV